MNELESVNLEKGAFEKLRKEHDLAAGAQEWKETASEAADALNEKDGAVSEILGELQNRLEHSPDAELAEAGALCGRALESVREAAFLCSDGAERIDSDPEALERLEETLSRWHQLMQKHGGTEESVIAAAEEISARISDLDGLGPRIAKLNQELEDARKRRDQTGRELAEKRKKVFARMARKIRHELGDLGLPDVRLRLQSRKRKEPGPLGTEEQAFLISTNPGIEPGPLGEVPSGGELSRITLAIAVVLAEKETTPVLIFDEVDSGVGGRLGKVIGEKLRGLSENRTVLAVTHTPQIAALADRQYMVEKVRGKDSTAVRVRFLEKEDRVNEITDMLGGGKAAERQAGELLSVR